MLGIRQFLHHNDVIMGAMAFQITRLMIVYSTVYSGADQRKHQSSVSLALLRGIHWGPVNSPHKWPVTRKTFPFDDVIMGGFLHEAHKRTSNGGNVFMPRRHHGFVAHGHYFFFWRPHEWTAKSTGLAYHK